MPSFRIAWIFKNSPRKTTFLFFFILNICTKTVIEGKSLASVLKVSFHFETRRSTFPTPSLTSCLSLTRRSSTGTKTIFVSEPALREFLESESKFCFLKAARQASRRLLWSVFVEMSGKKGGGGGAKGSKNKSPTRRLKRDAVWHFRPS